MPIRGAFRDHPASGGQELIHLRRGAKALVASADRVLLVRERHVDGSTFWTLPGGGIQTGESLAAGLGRELREELHVRPVIEAAVATFWYAHSSRPGVVTRYEVFDCSLPAAPVPARDHGILEHRWVRPDGLPAGTLPQIGTLIRSLDRLRTGRPRDGDHPPSARATRAVSGPR